ncbi:hypothetical protein LEP1GSC170_5791 [Leptospira interrogans serovar Bataviae str. HAI135]|nr:hypothetical protein LEP1GSC170_5791 [Leptospira interrogans serovar Bataviae str. HAI135]
MFPVCNLLTRAESPTGCLWQAGFAPVFLCRTHVILVFAGDIDGDGELDFIFDLKDHYNVSNEHLYISSGKTNDFFVVPVASNWNTGC